MKLVSAGALSALKWCRAGDNIKDKEVGREVYSSERSGFRLIEEQQS